jgi:hypothetical protein
VTDIGLSAYVVAFVQDNLGNNYSRASNIIGPIVGEPTAPVWETFDLSPVVLEGTTEVGSYIVSGSPVPDIIITGLRSNEFSIVDGVLSKSTPFDYEVFTQYSLNIRAVNSVNSSSISVLITVENVLEATISVPAPPIFAFNISETNAFDRYSTEFTDWLGSASSSDGATVTNNASLLSAQLAEGTYSVTFSSVDAPDVVMGFTVISVALEPAPDIGSLAVVSNGTQITFVMSKQCVPVASLLTSGFTISTSPPISPSPLIASVSLADGINGVITLDTSGEQHPIYEGQGVSLDYIGTEIAAADDQQLASPLYLAPVTNNSTLDYNTSGDPAVGGGGRVGQYLQAGKGTLYDANVIQSLTYTWEREGYGTIPGETSIQYLVQPSDLGHRVRAMVTVTDSANNTTGPFPTNWSGVILEALESEPIRFRTMELLWPSRMFADNPFGTPFLR